MELGDAQIVVGVDTTAPSQAALASALRLAAQHGAQLTVVSSDVGKEHDRMREAAVEAGVLVRYEWRPGSAEQASMEVAGEQGAELVVLIVSAAA